MEVMLSVTLCLGNGPRKPTGRMGPWSHDKSCCLQDDLMLAWYPGVTWQLQGQSRKEGGDRSKQPEVRHWLWGGEGPRVTTDDVGLLSQLYWLPGTRASTFPSLSFPICKMEVIRDQGTGIFIFSPPVSISLFSAPPRMLLWAPIPTHHDWVSPTHSNV